MAEKIYNRQAPSLSTNSPVVAPIDTTLSESLGERAVTTAKLAAENFALGQKMVLNGILDYGYQQASDSPREFIELTQSAFDKQMQGVPENMKKVMTANFLMSQQNYILKVENNYIKKQDAQLTESSQATLESINQNMQMANENLYSAMVNGRTQDIAIAKQQLTNLKRQAIAQSELKLSDGSYVYAKSDREKIKTGDLYDPQYDFEQAVDGMSMEKLREWDNEIFQNQAKYMQETGINKKTYKNQSKYIAGRLKDLGDTEKRILTSQADFAAAELISNFDPDKFAELKKQGLVNSDLMSAISDVGTKPQSVSEVISAYKLSNTLDKLKPIISNTDNSEIGNQERFAATTAILRDYSKFAQDNGLSIKEQQAFLGMLSKGLVDKNFSEALQPIFSDSALKDTLFMVSEFIETGTIKKDGIIGEIQSQARKLRTGETFSRVEQYLSDIKAKKNARALANQYVEVALTHAVAGSYDSAKEVLKEANRQVIKARNAPYINSAEFARLENELANGKKAYFTNSIGGTYEFMGYSNKDAIFKAVK